MDNFGQIFDELTSSIKENKRVLMKGVNSLPDKEKKFMGGIMNEMDSAFKKKDVNLLNGLMEKLEKYSKNDSNLSK